MDLKRDASLHILQHALGLDDYGRGKAYRNHFVTGPECDNWDLCMGHVEAGRMERHEPRTIFGGGAHCCFTVTEAGRDHVRSTSPKPPKRSRSKRRYEAWLDADSGLTFFEWLKAKRYKMVAP